jgi:Ca-activated chloride channel family protein
MTFRFEQPLWLWLIAAAVPLALIGYKWFAAMSGGRKASALLFRALLLALLASALAGLSMVRTTNALAVVAVVDVSESVKRFGSVTAPNSAAGAASSTVLSDPIERVRDFLAKSTRTRGPEDLLGVVVFDGQAVTIATPSRADVLDRPLDLKLADGSNLADAVRLARTLIPPDAAGRLILFSDGNETAGNIEQAAIETAGFARAGASRRGLPIDVVPISYNIDREVLVESVDAPPTAPAESTISLRVVLNATAPSTGTLRLLREGQPVAFESGANPTSRRLRLNPGRHVEVIEVPLNAAKVHRFRAVYEPDPVDSPDGQQLASGDTFSENNAAEAVTITPGKGSVLIIDGLAAVSPSILAATLRQAGIDTTLVPPENAPQDLLALQAFDLVILENVAADRLPTALPQYLTAYVQELGGGLVMVGGPDSFGAGGWRGTAIEPILPVKLDIPEKVVAPEVATLFVMDNSGSMNWAALGSGRSKQELATQSAALAISRLDKHDYVGLIVFNNSTEEVIPLALNSNPEENARKALNVGTGGGTNMVPALDEALIAMNAINVKQKHVIVLSDGKSMGRNSLVGRAEKLAAAGIKVSTIGFGLDADGPIMEQMAKAGGGEYYHVTNPNTLPRVFLKAVRLVRSPLIRETPFDPQRTGAVSPLLAGIAKVPRLNGLNLTQPRPEPTITTPLVSPSGEPLLAHWNVELGRVAAFTSDASDWAQPWITTDIYEQFWLQVVRQMARPATGRAFQGSSEVRGERLRVSVNAVAEDGKPLNLAEIPATVYAPSGESTGVNLAQVSPGLYEADIAAPEQGTYVTVARPSQGGKQLTPVLLGATSQQGPELRSLRSNDSLMQRVADITGGRVLDLASPTPASLFVRQGVSPQEAATAIWRTLLIWAIVMLLLDIATRRVAWDRWFSKEFGAEVVGAAREAVRDRSRQAATTLTGLRGTRDVQPIPETSAAMGDKEAAELIAAARDRRRAARLAEVQASASKAPSSSPPSSPSAKTQAPSRPNADATPEGGLAAAKRRAAKRFEDEN